MMAPWNAAAWARLQQRRVAGTLPHAILLCGASGLGKRVFATALVAALLCESPQADGHACGACRACRLVAAGTHPDRLFITLEMRDENAEGEQKRRSEITIEQMRALGQRLALTSQFGGTQVALIDPADMLNASAANALLKTLEEPTASTVIVLLADQPECLPATIRSRCQRIDFRIPCSSAALDWMRVEAPTVSAEDARMALAAADGNPGLALHWLRDGMMAMRDEVARDLGELQRGVVAPIVVARKWAGQDMDRRLYFAAALAAQQGRSIGRQHDAPVLDLTQGIELPKLAAWFDEVNRVRERLRGPLREEPALVELLWAWARVSPAAATTRNNATQR